MWWNINNLFKNLIENNKLKFINFYNKKSLKNIVQNTKC